MKTQGVKTTWSREQDAKWEQERHQAEVLLLLRAYHDPRRGSEWVARHLASPFVARRRERLKADARAQREKGSKGERWLP